jgi:hypothetical protein
MVVRGLGKELTTLTWHFAWRRGASPRQPSAVREASHALSSMACLDTALSASLGPTPCLVPAQRPRRCRAPCPSPARTTRSPRGRATCAWGASVHPGGGGTAVLAASHCVEECAPVPTPVLCAAGPAAFSAGRGAPRRVGPGGAGVEEAAAPVPVLVPAVPYDWRVAEQTLKPLPPPPEGVVDDPRVHNPRVRHSLPCAPCRVVVYLSPQLRCCASSSGAPGAPRHRLAGLPV